MGLEGAGSQEPPALREWRPCDVRERERCLHNQKPRGWRGLMLGKLSLGREGGASGSVPQVRSSRETLIWDHLPGEQPALIKHQPFAGISAPWLCEQMFLLDEQGEAQRGASLADAHTAFTGTALRSEPTSAWMKRSQSFHCTKPRTIQYLKWLRA